MMQRWCIARIGKKILSRLISSFENRFGSNITRPPIVRRRTNWWSEREFGVQNCSRWAILGCLIGVRTWLDWKLNILKYIEIIKRLSREWKMKSCSVSPRMDSGGNYSPKYYCRFPQICISAWNAMTISHNAPSRTAKNHPMAEESVCTAEVKS